MAYPLVAALFVACVVGRCVYEVLKQRGVVAASNPVVFAVVFADMTALWMSWFSMAELDPWKLGGPAAIKAPALAMTIAGGVLFLGAVLQLRGLENTKQLVTTGLFAKIRHPVYLGFVLWFVGWPLFHDAATTLLLGALGIMATAFWRHTEEQALVTQFGNAYVAYRNRTWI